MRNDFEAWFRYSESPSYKKPTTDQIADGTRVDNPNKKFETPDSSSTEDPRFWITSTLEKEVEWFGKASQREAWLLLAWDEWPPINQETLAIINTKSLESKAQIGNTEWWYVTESHV